LLNGKLNEQVLDHVAPVSVAAYFIGLHFGRREQASMESKKGQ
jgi:hypothetical protein